MRDAKNSQFPALSSLRTMAVAIAFLFPASTATAQIGHGLGLQKTCETPKKRCATDADCAPGCCTTTAGQNELNCQLQVTNLDEFADTWQINEAFDVVNYLNLEQTRVPASGNLPIVGTSGAALCSAGGTLPCILAVGASVTFQSSGYIIRPSDPNPLPDQARIGAQDLCNADGTQNCSTQTASFPVSNVTGIVSGCETSGCPPTPTPTPTISPTPTIPPTVTPTATPNTAGPPETPGPPGPLPRTATRTPKPTKTPKN
jgi:hypothetical protein